MKNFVQHGDTVTLSAPAGGVVSGGGYLIGALFGVAAQTVPAGQPFDLEVKGVFDLPRADGAVFTPGAPVFWDTAVQACNVEAEGRFRIGVALPGGLDVRVRLDGIGTSSVPAAI